jgi:two-component system, chemotaxis family, protein-glutamate methylesterase/glutaminase
MATRDLVVIGASAGGITALLDALGDGGPIDAAVLVVLHLPATARTALPDILARRAKTPAELARHGQRLERGRILVAPPDRHLLVGREAVRLSAGPRENRSRPAVDPLFRTAAASHGPRVVAIVLSGVMADGAAGMVAVRRSGGFGLVQHPDDAVFPSMPSSALELAGADELLPARQMRPLIDRLAREAVQPVEDGPDEPDVVELDVAGLEHAAEGGTLANRAEAALERVGQVRVQIAASRSGREGPAPISPERAVTRPG